MIQFNSRKAMIDNGIYRTNSSMYVLAQLRQRTPCMQCNIYTVHLIRWKSHRIHAFFPPASLPPYAIFPSLCASCSFSHDVVSTVNPPAHLHRNQLADSSVPDLTYMLQMKIPILYPKHPSARICPKPRQDTSRACSNSPPKQPQHRLTHHHTRRRDSLLRWITRVL